MDEERSFAPRVTLLPEGWEKPVEAVARAKLRLNEAVAMGIGVAEAEEVLRAAVASADAWFNQAEGP